MGQGWRRVTELMRQASVSRLPAFVPGVDPDFRPTSNARNQEMFREATEFSMHLRVLERDLLALHNSVESQLGTLRGILLSPLPRVYEEGQHGPVPSEEDARIIGQHVNVDRITESSREMRRRLDQEVIQPVKQWMVAYRTIQDRMKQLESLRLELDSRRRSVGDMQARFVRQRSVQVVGMQKFKTDMELEQLAHRLQHKDEKLQRTSSQYREMEQTVYNSLFTLVKDTSVLRDYAAAALLITEECFRAAHESFHEEGQGANEYGSTNQAPTTAPRYSAMADVAAAPYYGAEDGPYTAPENRRQASQVVQQQVSKPPSSIFRAFSEKVGFHKQRQQDIPESDAEYAAAGDERGGTSGGGGHDSDGDQRYDQGYDQGYTRHQSGGGMSEHEVAVIAPARGGGGNGYAVTPAYDGGGATQFRTATFGAGAPPASNNRYAAAAPLVATGGWQGNY